MLRFRHFLHNCHSIRPVISSESYFQIILCQQPRLYLGSCLMCWACMHTHTHTHTRDQDREELPHCAVFAMPVEEFRHAQYSALPSVEWQQRGRKHGRSFARLHHRKTTWRSAVFWGRRSETCGNSLPYVGSVWTEHRELTKGL